MTLAGRASGWFMAGLLLVLAAGIISLATTSRLAEANAWVEHTWDVLSHLHALLASASEAEAAERDYLVTGLDGYQDAYLGARTRFTHLSEKLTDLTRDNPAQQQRLATLEGLIHQRLQQMDEVLTTRREKGLAGALDVIRTGRRLNLMNATRQEIDTVTKGEKELLAIRLGTARRLVLATWTIIITSMAGTLLLIALGFRALRVTVVRPINELAHAAQRYGAGDLTQRLPVIRRDEVGQLAAEFNAMAERRQRVEAGLREATVSLDAVIGASPLPIIGITPQLIVRTWNHAAETMFGWSASEIRGHPLPIVPPEGRANFEQLIAQTLTGHVIVGAESVRQRKDGSLVEVSISASPLHLEGNTGEIVGVFEDIGARKDRERERTRMLESEQNLSRKLEALAHATISIAGETATDAAGLHRLLQAMVDRARSIANADYAALGIGADPDLEFDPWLYAGISPEATAAIGKAPRPRGLLGWVARQGQLTRVADLHQHVAFQHLPASYPEMEAFLGVPIRHEGKIVGNLFLTNAPGRPPFTEVDQRAIELLAAHAGAAIENARLHAAVLAERGRFRLLSEAGASLARTLNLDETLKAFVHAPVPSFADACLFDRIASDGTITRLAAACSSPEAREALMAVRGEAPPIWDSDFAAAGVARSGKSRLLGEITPAQFEKLLWIREPQRLAAALPLRSVIVVRVTAGQRSLGVLTLLSTNPARFGPDELSLAEELARRAALSLENARLFEEAQRAVRVRKDMLAIVSHDLRGPLSAIRLNTDLLARGLLSDRPGSAPQVDTIRRSVDRMSRMINDLLDAAAIEAGRLSIAPDRHAVEPCIRELFEMVAHTAREKNQRLEARLAAPLPDVRLDRGRILQVLGNLVGNAVKFTPEGGEILVAAEAQGAEVRFSVIDTGPGIDVEEVPNLFNRYAQASGTKQPGTGLGLFISRGIVEAHGGRIWVETSTGRGTAVRFTLPVWQPA